MANPIRTVLLLVATLLCGCGNLLPNNWVSSPNFNERRPNYVVIHQTDSVSYDSALDTLTNPSKQVSAHYLIAKNGMITQLVDEKNRAWHAGKSWWGGQTDMNSASIGIELDHQGDAPFEPAQIDALLKLLRQIGERYRIPVANHLAHGDVAPQRKNDPNSLFPWQTLAEQGFGLWCSAEESISLPNGLDPLLGLQAFGYDVSNSAKAALAFRRHFRSGNSSAQLADDDLRVLACLLTKKALSNKSQNSVENSAPPRSLSSE